MIIAQISDLHVKDEGGMIFRSVDPARHVENAVAALNAFQPQPDVVLLTGDLVDVGSAAEYARLRARIEKLRAPFRLIPGNHDARDTMRAAFPEHGYLAGEGGFCHFVDEAWPVRLVGMDSLDAGRVDGLLCASRLDWLDRQLTAAPDRPTLVFVHHPPFATGIAHMDAKPMRGADAFAAVIVRHRQVMRVVAGHVHRSMVTAWGGTIASTCPSTAMHFALDLAAEPLFRWTRETPGFQIHHWRGGRELVTHTVAIGENEPLTPIR
jgi:3',5'-cyclic AMP phosphodiesterase CpdA